MSEEQERHISREYSSLDRRQFIKGAGAGTLSFTVLNSARVRGAQRNSTVSLGMIGCGMRGTWIADLFVRHGGYEFVGAADYFQDQVDEFGEKYGIPQDHRHTTLSGYRRLLDQKPDAVVIESPPYFHPIQARDAVDAGIHVFLAKPIAVDVPGTLLVRRLGRQAAAKGLSFLVDFQTRTSPLYQEAVRRVHEGAIGEIGLGEASFNGGDVWNSWNPIGRYLEARPSDPEARLRAWGLDRALSGDILVEQCIHSIDVATWVLGAPPKTAYGTGGKYNYEHGDIWDCFAVTYRFPDEAALLVNAKQFGKGYSSMGCRLYGVSGTIETNYGGEVAIRGDRPFTGGRTENLYTEGALSNISDFYRDITEGPVENSSVEPSVQSNLAAILGREASYARREVGWEEVLHSVEEFEPSILEDLKS